MWLVCEVSVASGRGWNLSVWLVGVVVRKFIDFLMILIPTPLLSALLSAASLANTCSLKKCFSFLFWYFYCS